MAASRRITIRHFSFFGWRRSPGTAWGAETGEDKMLIISVGSGSGPSYENPDKSILSQIPGLISALMYAAEVDQDRRECEARPRSDCLLSAGHPSVGATLACLGRVLLAQRQFSAARIALERALNIQRRHLRLQID